MTELEKIEAEKDNSISVIYHSFVLLTSKDEGHFYCFVEGRDAPYYIPRIQQISGCNAVPIICKGKTNVIKAYKWIKSQHLYDKYKQGYFVDSDFDKNEDEHFHTDIYVTPCYSIENLYVDEKVLKEILKCEFNILHTHNEYQIIIDLFKKEQEKFHNESKLFNAWYACQKARGCEKVSLKNNFPKELGIVIKIGDISSQYDLEIIKAVFPEAFEIQIEEIEDKMRELSEDFSKKLRGKYEILFIEKFLRFLITDANSKENRNFVKTKTIFNIDGAQIISQLSQYAVTPKCLESYIVSRISKVS